jgi:hypothetical protein
LTQFVLFVRTLECFISCLVLLSVIVSNLYLAPFGYDVLKFNFHHINVAANVWSTKCRLIACMSTQIRSNLRDESIKPN